MQNKRSAMPLNIPFNRPWRGEREATYVAEVMAGEVYAGNGPFSRRCRDWLKMATGSAEVLLTPSCTAALEMCALLLDLHPRDEIIMPSFTFVTSASAFALHGATPVFVDINPNTQNIDPQHVAAAITPRTRGIVAVHYGGVPCDLTALRALAERHGLILIEDAAQAICARSQGRALGAIGHLGAISFHETKNIHCGEGGALLINDRSFVGRAEVIWEKGTNRSQFLRGVVDKYTWVDLGSSFLLSEINAAFLLGQLETAESITEARRVTWRRYHAALEPLAEAGLLVRPCIPEEATPNAHIYYVILPSLAARSRVIEELKVKGVQAFFHYVPLHDSPAGRRFGRTAGSMESTRRAGDCLVRLPLWYGMTDEPEIVSAALTDALGSV
jgi:dTDP-4-amino-4,6-dideoxygalactose transaminase